MTNFMLYFIFLSTFTYRYEIFSKQNLTDNNFACHANFTYWWVVLVINWGHLARTIRKVYRSHSILIGIKQKPGSLYLGINIHFDGCSLQCRNLQQQTTWKVSKIINMTQFYSFIKDFLLEIFCICWWRWWWWQNERKMQITW